MAPNQTARCHCICACCSSVPCRLLLPAANLSGCQSPKVVDETWCLPAVPLAKASCDSPWDSEFIRAIPRPIILAGDIEHRLRNDAVEVFVAGTEDVRRDVDIAGPTSIRTSAPSTHSTSAVPQAIRLLRGILRHNTGSANSNSQKCSVRASGSPSPSSRRQRTPILRNQTTRLMLARNRWSAG